MKTWMAGTSPAMTANRFGPWPEWAIAGMAQAGEAERTRLALLVDQRGDHSMENDMRKATGLLVTLAGAVAIGTLGGLVQLAGAQDSSAAATYRDIEQTLGSVPGFFKQFPEAGIAGAWAEFKSVQLNAKTKLDAKTKELIGLAVSAQIPCQYCIYFHTAAAKANGATDEEVREAVAMAAIARHWSTVLNGMQIDLASFKNDTDTVLRAAAEKAKTVGKSQ
jgi:AhpD family alkylhydroperoxidase